MSATLRLEPLGRVLPVAEGQSLLEAALAAGIRLRSSCRNGTCRECLATLEAGTVRYRVEWPGLSPDERAACAEVLHVHTMAPAPQPSDHDPVRVELRDVQPLPR